MLDSFGLHFCTALLGKRYVQLGNVMCNQENILMIEIYSGDLYFKFRKRKEKLEVEYLEYHQS